ncbi:hypothetical protein NDU88_002755 [Pleurodeles waltl]|uniref:Uncharacterized protein n=1 Tax=Pleurodeles waltl TaxID=8319 RepID=A0AAV7REC4_PLEWA|nr:hypothetical protein NDU88_002755 [Pleurodeles waltl]
MDRRCQILISGYEGVHGPEAAGFAERDKILSGAEHCGTVRQVCGPSGMSAPSRNVQVEQEEPTESTEGVLGLEQRVSTVETHITSFADRDQELLYLRSRLIDLEDRSRRDNVRFLGFPETIEGTDIHSYLRETLPKLTGRTFNPHLQFQRVNRLGPKGEKTPIAAPPIIACVLRHMQTCQLLEAARAHGPFRMDGLEIRLMADFSEETS